MHFCFYFFPTSPERHSWSDCVPCKWFSKIRHRIVCTRGWWTICQLTMRNFQICFYLYQFHTFLSCHKFTEFKGEVHAYIHVLQWTIIRKNRRKERHDGEYSVKGYMIVHMDYITRRKKRKNKILFSFILLKLQK